MPELMEYKCPSCGGAISFDSTSQKMTCPFCDATFDPESLKAYDNELKNEKPSEMEWEMQSEEHWREGEQEGMFVYSCQSCGGEIVGDETLAATSCPYCDNPVVMAGQFSGTLRPDYVIPFKLDKKAATDALKKHMEKKRLVPKIFKEENHIDEIKGIYVPFWLFDADADANIRYKATRTRAWSDSRYNYVETSYYSVAREGAVSFNMVPVDGSSKMPDDLMESIEPYNYSEVVDFQTAYLAGYLADKYDIDANQSIESANSRVKKSTEDAFANTVTGFSSVVPEYSNIHLANGKVRYALLPVWVLNTSWNDQKYLFAMNGQTGKLVGDLPLDKKAYMRWFGIITATVATAAFIVQFFMGM